MIYQVTLPEYVSYIYECDTDFGLKFCVLGEEWSGLMEEKQAVVGKTELITQEISRVMGRGLEIGFPGYTTAKILTAQQTEEMSPEENAIHAAAKAVADARHELKDEKGHSHELHKELHTKLERLKHVQLAIGNLPHKIQKFSQGSTGYTWSVESEDEEVVRTLTSYPEHGKDTSHLCGGGRDFTLEFHAVVTLIQTLT